MCSWFHVSLVGFIFFIFSKYFGGLSCMGSHESFIDLPMACVIFLVFSVTPFKN